MMRFWMLLMTAVSLLGNPLDNMSAMNEAMAFEQVSDEDMFDENGFADTFEEEGMSYDEETNTLSDISAMSKDTLLFVMSMNYADVKEDENAVFSEVYNIRTDGSGYTYTIRNSTGMGDFCTFGITEDGMELLTYFAEDIMPDYDGIENADKTKNLWRIEARGANGETYVYYGPVEDDVVLARLIELLQG